MTRKIYPLEPDPELEPGEIRREAGEIRREAGEIRRGVTEGTTEGPLEPGEIRKITAYPPKKINDAVFGEDINFIPPGTDFNLGPAGLPHTDSQYEDGAKMAESDTPTKLGAAEIKEMFDNVTVGSGTPVVKGNKIKGKRCAICPRTKDRKSRQACMRCERLICAEHSKQLLMCVQCL